MRAHKNKRSEKVCGNAENVRVNIRGEFAEGAELMGGGSGQALYKVLWRMLETSEEGLILFGECVRPFEIQSMELFELEYHKPRKKCRLLRVVQKTWS